MKNLKFLLLSLFCLFLFNSCSEEEEVQLCPQTENISMKINGQEMEFTAMGWGIDLDRDDTGHTLHVQIFNGTLYPQQDSWSLTLFLPYKKTGNNIIEKIHYFRVPNATPIEGYFYPGDLQSKVTINTSNCISLTFSGRIVIDGNETIITEGIIDHVYPYPFDNE